MQSYRERIEILEAKLAEFELVAHKVKKEIAEEFEKTMPDHQQEVQELNVAKQELETDASAFKTQGAKVIIDGIFLSSVSP